MSTALRSVVLVIAIAIGASLSASAQQPPAAPAAPAAPAPPAAPAAPTAPAPPVAPRPGGPAADETIPVRIDLALSRHLGEKRISNFPFTMLATANPRSSASLRVGSNVPIPSPVLNSATGTAVTSYQYQTVGTNIDVTVSVIGVGRFRLDLRLEDSSVAEPAAPGTAVVAAPIIRTNSLNTTLVLRDGLTTELVVASDKVSGETIKAEVRLTVIK